MPIPTSEIDPRFPEAIAHQLTLRGLDYKEKPVRLRAGGESHWYFDAKLALSLGLVMHSVGNLAIRTAQSEGLDYRHLGAMGAGGKALMSSMVISAIQDFRENLTWTDAYKGEPDDPDNGLGGADVLGKKLLLVDDVFSTGSSLSDTALMIRDRGGRTEEALVMVDRSDEAIRQKFQEEHGIAVTALFKLSETEGKIMPVIYT